MESVDPLLATVDRLRGVKDENPATADTKAVRSANRIMVVIIYSGRKAPPINTKQEALVRAMCVSVILQGNFSSSVCRSDLQREERDDGKCQNPKFEMQNAEQAPIVNVLGSS